MNTETTPQASPETARNQAEREPSIDLKRVFGDRVGELSDEQMARINDAKPGDPLYEAMQKAANLNAGTRANERPELFEYSQADEPQGRIEGPAIGSRLFALKTYFAERRAQKREERINKKVDELDPNLTDEEWDAAVEEIEHKDSKRLRNRIAMGAAALFGIGAGVIAYRAGALDSILNGDTNGVDNAVTPSGAPGSHEAADSVHTVDTPKSGEHGAHDPQGHILYGETLEKSHMAELDFLDSNGRHNNDFNNIPIETLDDPANKDHFPGYEALKEQFQKSPNELAAQLRQIQAIEMGSGQKLDFIPDEFRELVMKPGEDQEAYIARLGEAIHGNDDLHQLLTDGALKYIEENASPLRDLTENYSANYIVLENGVPTVRLDTFVQSADPNDKVLMLSETEGIRFPCGQCITIMPVEPEPIYTPSISYQPEYVEQPVAVSTPVVEVSNPPVTISEPPVTVTEPPVTVTEPPVPESPVDVEEPPIDLSKPADPMQWQDHGRDSTTDSGVGKKPLVDAGALTDAPEVDQTQPASRPSRGPGMTAPQDSSSSAPGSETGVSRGGDTRPNAGVGQSGAAQSTGGETSSGDTGGPAA